MVRMCTLPTTHPLHALVLRAVRVPVKRHRSVLHQLLYLFDLDPRTVETVLPSRLPSHRTPPIHTEIAGNPNLAVASDAEWTRKGGIRVYSDGSDYANGVGAAAVLYRSGRPRRDDSKKTTRIWLGPSSRHTVYEAELAGIMLGLELIRREPGPVSFASIAVDNQAAILSLRSRKSGAGQHLVDAVSELERRVRKKHNGIVLTIRWVPGHLGVDGNEDVDREAKKAAKGASSEDDALPTYLRHGLPRSASKINQLHAADLESRAAAQWRNSKYYERTKAYDNCYPLRKYGNYIEGLPRRHAALLFQLRAGRSPLQKSLYQTGCADSPVCPACEETDETTEHYLLRCNAYARPRARLFFECGRLASSLPALLSKPELRRPLFTFIHATGRFRQRLGDLLLSRKAMARLDAAASKKRAQGKTRQARATRGARGRGRGTTRVRGERGRGRGGCTRGR